MGVQDGDDWCFQNFDVAERFSAVPSIPVNSEPIAFGVPESVPRRAENGKLRQPSQQMALQLQRLQDEMAALNIWLRQQDVNPGDVLVVETKPDEPVEVVTLSRAVLEISQHLPPVKACRIYDDGMEMILEDDDVI